MGFNFKAFATAFMDDQAKAIQKRIQDAEDYEDQQRELAERNKSVVGKRRALVNLAKTEINMLRKLGAKDKHINAAIAAGPKALFEFSQSLQKEAQKRPSAGGSYTFSDSELDAFIDMPDEFSAQAMDPAEHYANSIGLASPSLGSYQAKDQGFIKSALGMGLKDSARARLDKDAYYEGYSMMDINEVARQEAYESMDPGTYFSFSPSKDYNPVTVGPAFREAYDDSGELSQAVESQLRRQFPAEADYMQEKARIIARQRAGVIDAYAQQFGKRFLEDTSINLQGLMGDDLYQATYMNYQSQDDLERYIVDGLLDLENISVGSTVKTKDNEGRIVEITLGEGDEVSRMKINGRVVDDDDVAALVANLQKQGLLSQSSIAVGDAPLPEGPPEETVEKIFFPGDPTPEGGFDGKLHYVKETDKGRGVALGVPPRPAEGLFAEFRGSGMDGETRDKILSGEMSVPNNLKPSQWDELFGDTHNADGTRKVTVDTTETMRYTESNPLDLKTMSSDEAEEAYENLKKGEYFINPADGRVLPKR